MDMDDIAIRIVVIVLLILGMLFCIAMYINDKTLKNACDNLGGDMIGQTKYCVVNNCEYIWKPNLKGFVKGDCLEVQD